MSPRAVLPVVFAVAGAAALARAGLAAPQTPAPSPAQFLTQPLITSIYTADPSAHVFGGRIYIYPSHDIDAGVPPDDLGSHFAMRDYHVLSMDAIGGAVTDHGVALDIASVPWAGKQMWAPDAAEKDGKYYLYFPAKDKQDVFRIGVAVGDRPAGPFTAQPQPIAGSFSIDPAVFKDTDGAYYMYFGGIWGGQLQRWATGTYSPQDVYPANDRPALSAKVARLSGGMTSFAEAPRDVVLVDEQGKPLTAGDNGRRFFEASWMHKYNGTYYFSYSTGDTHFIMYATSRSPYGPFTVKGKVLEPVLGWTNHHSIVEFGGKWYLFYHDAQLSGGQTHLRNVKVTELKYRPDGSIETVTAYRPTGLPRVDAVERDVHNGHVMTVKIADLKNHLSRHLAAVRRGAEITVYDRDAPIARIIPFVDTPRAGRGGRDGERASADRLAELVRTGVIAPGEPSAVADRLGTRAALRPPAGAPRAVDLLIDERRASRR